MLSNPDYIELFAESLFNGEATRCVFESSTLGNISQAQLVYILTGVIEQKEQVSVEAVELDGSATSIGAISILAAMCLGARVSIINVESDNDITKEDDLSSVVRNIIVSSFEAGEYQYVDEMLESCKDLFIKNAPKFELELQTSGTTGMSNKVMLDARGICYQAVEVTKAVGINESDRQLMYMPFNYVYGLSVLTTGLYSRSTLVESAFNMEQPKSFFEQLPEKRITVFSGVPYVYNLIAKRWGVKNLAEYDLRVLTQAGGLLGENIKNEILDLDADLDFWVMYGQTEFGGRISQVNLAENRSMINSVGPPLDGVFVEVELETDNQGIEGEIFVKSISSAKNIDDLARSVEFEGTTYHSTGDIGYIIDGHIHVTGRNKNFVKVAGKRVNIGYIEKDFRSLSSVVDCVVEYNESRFPIFLIGIISEGFEGYNTQQEIKTYFNSLFASENHIKDMLVGVPYYAYVLHGSPPRLPSNKLDVSRLKVILKESYHEKKPVHIWM